MRLNQWFSVENASVFDAAEVTTSPIDGAASEYMRHPPEWWVFEAEARATENEADVRETDSGLQARGHVLVNRLSDN
ncbi:hypothetical protein TNCT_646661 [Trichonephila clavata]|uniref:Uncharacterized protein n=1 Tax=Trichonephila clavata TaxID=2740835 RepID=A0A8X6GQ31_TRICU|nr:hypothetical protein TNCT_646661 [Trichonephila clavata]